MAVQVDDGGGRLLRRKIEALGVTVHTQKSTSEIVDGDPSNGGARHKMKFADGSELETDMIVFSAGIRPRDDHERQAPDRKSTSLNSSNYCATRMPTSA